MAFVPVSPRVAWAYRVTLSTPLCHAASHQCLTVSPYHPMLPCLTPCRLGLSHHPVHTVVPHLTSLFCHLVPSHPISLSCPVSPHLAVSSCVNPCHPVSPGPVPSPHPRCCATRFVDVLPSRCHGIIPCHTLSPRVARACDIADPTLCHRVSVLSRRLKVSLMS